MIQCLGFVLVLVLVLVAVAVAVAVVVVVVVVVVACVVVVVVVVLVLVLVLVVPLSAPCSLLARSSPAPRVGQKSGLCWTPASGPKSPLKTNCG